MSKIINKLQNSSNFTIKYYISSFNVVMNTYDYSFKNTTAIPL